MVGVLAIGCGDDPAPSEWDVDEDEDGWPARLDCDDSDPSVFAGADDLPGDGIDQDCSGSDARGDAGDGGAGGACEGCGGGGGPGLVDEDGDGWPASVDCDDADPERFPGARDVPHDGIDQDCDGSDLRDFDGDGFDGGEGGDDCDDEDPAIHPGRVELVLDGIDQSCDGSDLPAPVLLNALGQEAQPAAAPSLAAGRVDGEDVMLLAWADSRVAPAQDLYARLVDADGVPLGAEIAVETTENTAKTDVRVASNGDGFLVSWTTQSGVYVRRLHADGTPNGAVLGYGSAGGVRSRPVWSGENWLVVWTDSIEQQALVRAMTPTGVRSDTIFELPAAAVNLDVASSGDGAFVVWDGPLPNSATFGLTGQFVSSLGEPLASPAVILPEPAEGPAVARLEDGFALVFRVPGSLGYVTSVELNADGERQGEPRRLSSESVAQSELFIVADGSDYFSVWRDFRHASGPMGAQAIYGNGWRAGAVTHSPAVASIAASSVAPGGIVSVGERLWMSSLSSFGFALMSPF